MNTYRDSVPLSRLTITGPNYDYTPLCVLIEIADAHGILYDESDFERPNFGKYLIDSISTTLTPNFEYQNTVELKNLARFINKNVLWPQSKLFMAYRFLMKFMKNDDPLLWIPNEWTVGLQTPTHPEAINACILYKTCIYHQLNVTFHTTINQMNYVVQMLRESSDSIFRRVRNYLDRDVKRIDLINILLHSSYEIKDPDRDLVPKKVDLHNFRKIGCSDEMLQKLHTSLYNVKILQEKMEPTTDYGSIALAAINYSIDISRSHNL